MARATAPGPIDAGIRALYDSPDYPLPRRKPKAAATAKPAATAAPRR